MVWRDIHFQREDIEAATDFAEQAVTGIRRTPTPGFSKVTCSRMQGKIDPALAAYDQVVKLKPNSFIAYLNKASLEIGTGKFEAAEADIKAARKAAPGSLMVFYTQALLDFNQGKHSAALESLQQVLSKVPEHMPSRLLAGAVQVALGSAQQAEQHLKYYLERDPGNIYARKLLASVLLKSRQTQRAIDVLAPPSRARNRTLNCSPWLANPTCRQTISQKRRNILKRPATSHRKVQHFTQRWA